MCRCQCAWISGMGVSVCLCLWCEKNADAVRECGHRPGGRYGRRPVIGLEHRSSQVVSEIRYIHIFSRVGRRAYIMCCCVRPLAQGALALRLGRTFVSRSVSWSVSDLGRDALSGIWATPPPLDLGHGGIRRAEFSGMSVGRSVVTVGSGRPGRSWLRALCVQ